MNKNIQNNKAVFKIRKFRIFTFPVEHLNHVYMRNQKEIYDSIEKSQSNFLDYF